MNNCNFAGNVGNVRYNTGIETANGPSSVLNFSLAVAKRQKGPDGRRLTLWVDCALWGTRADALQQYISKGTKLAVSGAVDVDSYQDGNGATIPKLKLNVQELTLQGGGEQQQGQAQDGQQQAAPQYRQPAQPQQRQQAAPPPSADFDDDIPF